MPAQRYATIADYIDAAPEAARPHLAQMYRVLRAAAPDAEAIINTTFPEALVRRIAEFCVEQVAAREDEGFW